MGVIWTPEAVDKTKRSGLVLSRQNILTRGLIAGIVGGHPFDVVRGDGLVNSGAERVASQNGSAWSLASGEYLDSGNSGISVATGAKWSAMVLVRSTSSAHSGQYAVCVNYNGSSVALALTLGTSVAATGAAIFDGGYWRSSGISTSVYGDGRYHVILGVRNGPDLHYYVDGRLDSSYTMPFEASPGTSTTAITWGQYKNDGTNTTMVGELALGFVWSGIALTASDAKALASDPWQLFEADNDPVFYSLGGGGSTVTGVGSSDGVGTVSGVGASTSAQVGSSAGVGAASGVGASTANSVGSSTGTGAADGVGSSTGGSNGVGASTGTGTASGIGASTAASTGSSDGVGAGSGVGASTSASTGSASGTGTASGVGTNGSVVSTGVGSASGTGTATGISPTVSRGGGKTTGSNLSRKQKKKLKAVESQEWLKAEETARQLLSDRFTKQTPQEKAQALETYIESLQPVIEALKALTSQIEEVVEEAPVIELTPHQEVIQRFDRLEKKVKSVEELIIILMADL